MARLRNWVSYKWTRLQLLFVRLHTVYLQWRIEGCQATTRLLELEALLRERDEAKETEKTLSTLA